MLPNGQPPQMQPPSQPHAHQKPSPHPSFAPPNPNFPPRPPHSGSTTGYPSMPQRPPLPSGGAFRPLLPPQQLQTQAGPGRGDNLPPPGMGIQPQRPPTFPPAGPRGEVNGMDCNRVNGMTPPLPPRPPGPHQFHPQMQQPYPQAQGPPTPAQSGASCLLPPPRNYCACPPVSGQHSTPTHSEPPSAKSSRNPSPIPSQRYDSMEGQFSSTASPSAAVSPNFSGPPPPNLPPSQRLPIPPQMGAPPPTGGPSPHTSGPPQMSGPSSPYGSQIGPGTGQSMAPPQQSYPALPQQSYPPSSNSMTRPMGMTSSGFSPSGNLPPSGMVPNAGNMGRRYPAPLMQQPNNNVDGLSATLGGLSVTQGFNKIWGSEAMDLLQQRHILPPDAIEAPKIHLQHEHLSSANCSPEIFRCTLTKIPETASLLQKSRLPLGILVHPFKDLNHLPVIQCSTIVRCRACRTYINPFVYFVDQRRWKCNLCFRVNELPEEFQYDPVSKTYGDPSRRPEVKSSTIEFIAPSEYMLRPPQPAVYLFVLDVSRAAVETGYLKLFCDVLLESLDKLPGDSRTQVGFLTVDRNVHFYSLAEGLSQPHQMVVGDIEDIFLPCPDNLLVNLHESKELVRDLLTQLPTQFLGTHETDSALGSALQAAFKLMSPTGGRVTVMQAVLPSVGPGALKMREDPNQRAGKEATSLSPATDFYKRLALDCSAQQVAVDLFLLNGQYADLASLSCISKFSGGCIYHFPQLQAVHNPVQSMRYEKALQRYLTRKIGFEAVMRIRCSRGMAIHTFHGNFFVRSTDLLSLPNINPDAGFGMQVSIEESLSDLQSACFQAALLYTSSKGERRIRVHTLCLPIAAVLSDVMNAADQQCIVGLLAKMAVDRSQSSSLLDAREAMMNAVIDSLVSYRLMQSMGPPQGLLAPPSLQLLPLYILGLLKHVAFRTGLSTRVDDRVFAMSQMKTMPLSQLIQAAYPDLYPVHVLHMHVPPLPPSSNGPADLDKDGDSPPPPPLPKPPRLQLSSEKVNSTGAYLMDVGDSLILYVGRNIPATFCQNVLGVPHFQAIAEHLLELPEIETAESEQLRSFVEHLQSLKPHAVPLLIIRDDSKQRVAFIERLIEDRSEIAFSYYEFLQHLKTQVK